MEGDPKMNIYPTTLHTTYLVEGDPKRKGWIPSTRGKTLYTGENECETIQAQQVT